MSTNPMIERCHARNRSGSRCGHWSTPGHKVCHLHGSRSPQALRKAEERLRALVDPSVARLAELIAHADSDSVSLTALRYVLDYAGFKPADKAQIDQALNVTVTFDRPDTLSLPDGS